MNNLFSIFNLYLYIYFYIIIFLFFSIFLYIRNFNNSINNSIDYNVINYNNFNKIHFWLFLASLVGIPPLLGFFSKFVLFLTLFSLQKINFMIVFIIFNIFIMIFYLQQIRFFQNKKNKFYKTFKNQNNSIELNTLIIFFQLFNVFAFIYLPIIVKFLFCSIWI